MKSLDKFIKSFGLATGIGSVLGAGSLFVVYDIMEKQNEKKSEGLNLVWKGAHLSKGNHRVVITDQFWKAYIPNIDDPIDKEITINGMKKAYEDLNAACDGVSFELCTTESEPAKYGVKKIDKLQKDDIALYVKDIISNSNNVFAQTSFKRAGMFSSENKDISITYKTDALNLVCSKDYLAVPQNAAVYYITVHESMHAMGFAHEEKRDSVMYPQASFFKFDYRFLEDPNHTCLTEKDKLALDKYCVQFYDVEPKYKENGGKQTVSAPQKKVILEEELSF